MKIVPGILVADEEEAERQLQAVAGLVDWVQVDFLDGEYADNRTLQPSEVPLQRFKPADDDPSWQRPEIFTRYEAHLMVSQPNVGPWIQEALEAAFDRIVVQVESLESQLEYGQRMKWQGVAFGVSLDAQTMVSRLVDELLEQVAVVQVMTIQAGFQGQQFQEEMLFKVEELALIREKRGLDFQIEVDGGMSLETVKLAAEAGADLVVAGSGVFGSVARSLNHEIIKSPNEVRGNVAENVRRLEEAMRS